MTRPLIAAVILWVAGAAPGFAGCQQELLAAGSKLSEYSGSKGQLAARYEQAKRLCRAGKDTEATKMARGLRADLAPPTPAKTVPSDIPKYDDTEEPPKKIIPGVYSK